MAQWATCVDVLDETFPLIPHVDSCKKWLYSSNRNMFQTWLHCCVLIAWMAILQIIILTTVTLPNIHVINISVIRQTCKLLMVDECRCIIY